MTRRSRSTRSYLFELVVIVVALVLFWAWLTYGGPSAFGEWFGPMFMPQPS